MSPVTSSVLYSSISLCIIYRAVIQLTLCSRIITQTESFFIEILIDYIYI